VNPDIAIVYVATLCRATGTRAFPEIVDDELSRLPYVLPYSSLVVDRIVRETSNVQTDPFFTQPRATFLSVFLSLSRTQSAFVSLGMSFLHSIILYVDQSIIPPI
jgi:hypothetical protein